MKALFAFLDALDNALFHLLHNGRKPTLEIRPFVLPPRSPSCSPLLLKHFRSRLIRVGRLTGLAHGAAARGSRAGRMRAGGALWLSRAGVGHGPGRGQTR
jgi:hypothetical protein